MLLIEECVPISLLLTYVLLIKLAFTIVEPSPIALNQPELPPVLFPLPLKSLVSLLLNKELLTLNVKVPPDLAHALKEVQRRARLLSKMQFSISNVPPPDVNSAYIPAAL